MIDTVDIHPTAIVSPDAQIGENVRIGAYTIIEDDVEIGDGTEIRSHVVLANGARIGRDCRIFPGAVISTEPQDLKYNGEPTLVFVGDRTTVREFATINRGTTFSGKTEVGSDCLIMAYCHVAHDCVVGDHVIMGNSCQLAGHVTIQDWSILGGMTKVHQFCTIGKHTMIGADVMLVKDVTPYALTGRDPIRNMGINKIGLRRRGFSPELIAEIERFFDVVFFSGKNTSEGIREYTGSGEPRPEIQEIISFIESSKRGVYR